MKIFKTDSELNCKEFTVRFKVFRVIFWALLSSVVLLSFGMIYNRPKTNIKYVEMLIIDTIDVNKMDTFMVKAPLNEKNLIIYAHHLNFTHPFETVSQMLFETDHLRDFKVRTLNNLGGYQTSQGYVYFPHWTDCVRFAKKWQQQHGLKKTYNFYQWLDNSGYHEADNATYNAGLRHIEIGLKQKYKLKDILYKL